MVTPILLRKAPDQNSTAWFYKTGDDFGRISLKNGNLYEQFQALTDIFRVAYDEPLFISSALHESTLDILEENNPDFRYAYITRTVRRIIFNHRVWNPELTMRKTDGTTYVCSDASGGLGNDSNSWAFVSTDPNVSYGFGMLDKTAITSFGELTGFINALRAHKNSEDRVVFYTDSLDTVRFIEGEDVVNFSRYELEDPNVLREEALDLLSERGKKDRLQWVRGHRTHRLNILADAVANMARHWTRSQFSRQNHMLGYAALAQFA